MRSLAVWSALGGGAACAAVAGVAVNRMGGVESVLSTLQETVSPANSHAAATLPSPKETLTSRQSAPEPASSLVSKANVSPPAFDVVRVEPSGETVIAGHSAPHASVDLRDNGKTVGHIEADNSGQFVIIPNSLAAGDHALQLVARGEGGPEQSSAVAPVKVEALAAAAAAKPVRTVSTMAGAMVTAAPSPILPPSPAAAGLSTPVVTSAPIPPQASPQPSPNRVALAPAVSPSPVAPLAAPHDAQSSEEPQIAMARPNEAGGFEAQGTALPGAKVRLRLNGSYIAEVVADALGRWSLTVEHGLTAGLYALRAETVDAAGKSKSAADLSFAYAPHPPAGPTAPSATAPAVASSPQAEQVAPSTSVIAATPAPFADPSHAVVAEIRTTTVVQGDNLWDLARHFYGDGLRYSDIFQANAQLIHNPNLIYIGQVFVVPQTPSQTR